MLNHYLRIFELTKKVFHDTKLIAYSVLGLTKNNTNSHYDTNIIKKSSTIGKCQCNEDFFLQGG